MKKLLRVLGLTALLMLGACGSIGNNYNKHVLSHWTLFDYDYIPAIGLVGATIDLRHGTIGSYFSLDFSYSGYVFCETQMKLIGGANAGIFRMEAYNCGDLDYQEGTYRVGRDNVLALTTTKTKYLYELPNYIQFTEYYR